MGVHAIENLAFEVGFRSEADAEAHQAQLAEFATGRGLEVIEQVFDEFAGADDIVRLDVLEIDLGDVSFLGAEANVEMRLREAVREALGELLERAPGEAEAQRRAMEAGGDADASAAPPRVWRGRRSEAELDQVWRHLKTGRLEWQDALQDAAAFDALVTRVVAEHGVALVERLRAAPDRARLLDRLARQWPQAARARLAALASAEGGEGGEAVEPSPGAGAAGRSDTLERRLMGIAAPAAGEATRSIDGSGRAAATTTSGDGTGAPDAHDPADTPAGSVLADLVEGEREEAWARLRRLAQTPGRRAALLDAMTEAHWRTVLEALFAADDAEALAALVSSAAAWRLGATVAQAVVARALGDALLAQVLSHAPADLPDAAARAATPNYRMAVVRALVAARGRIDGLAPARVAAGLLANAGLRERLQAWLRPIAGAERRNDEDVAAGSPTGPAASPSPGLRGVSGAGATAMPFEEDRTLAGPHTHPGSSGEQAAAASDPAPAAPEVAALLATPTAAAEEDPLADSPERAALEDQLARAWLDPEPWATLLLREPSWVMARLRHHGRAAAWRRAFAAALSLSQFEEILRLWAEPADAAFLVRLVEADATWAFEASPAEPAGRMAARLRAWLLSEALAAGEGAASAVSTVVWNLLRRRADHNDLQPAEAARRLMAAWPDHGPAASARPVLTGILAGMSAGLAPEAASAVEASVPEPPRSPPSEPGGAGETAPAPASLDMHADSMLRRRLSAAFDRAQPAGLQALVRAALAEDRAWLLAEAGRRGTDPDFWLWLAAVVEPALLFELAQTRLSEPAVRVVMAIAPADGADRAELSAFWAALFGGLWSRRATAPVAGPDLPLRAPALVRRLLAVMEPRARRAAVLALRSMGGFLRDEAGQPHPGPTPARAAEASDEPAPPSGAPSSTALPPTVQPPRSQSTPDLAAWLGRLPERPTAAVRGAVVGLLTPAAEGLRQLEAVGEVQRRDLLRRLRPADGAAALAWLDTLSRAAAAAALPSPVAGVSGFNWRFLLGELLEEDRLFEPAGFARRWIAARLAEAPAQARGEWRLALAQAVEAARRQDLTPTVAHADAAPPAIRAATAPDRRAGLDLITEALDAVAASEALASPLPEPSPTLAPSATEPLEAEPIEGTLYVANAGVVLAGPYIPMLFERLDLTRVGAFIDDAAAERAVHLLQFLVDGGEAAAEHQLVLNKLLCGLPLETPIGRDFQIRDAERETIEGLLRAMIERWSILGGTSVAGLRESFLQRQGALTLEPEDWRLLVEPRAFDMLLDQIPWGFSMLKLPWMAEVLHVDWR